MNLATYRALFQRELIELTRAFRPSTRVLRCLLSAGVFLPLLCGRLPWLDGSWISDLFQMLILSVGSAYLAVWVHESSERDWLNQESLATTGVSPTQLFLAKAMVGAAVGSISGMTALTCFWLLAPILQLSSAAIIKSALFLMAGLNVSLNCSLWAASKPRPRAQVMPAIVLSLIAAWLGLPVLGECLRDTFGLSMRFQLLHPVMTMAPSMANSFGTVLAGLSWMAFISMMFLLGALRRLQRGERAQAVPGKGKSLILERFLLGEAIGFQPKVEHPYARRLLICSPDTVYHLRQEIWFLVTVAVGLLVQYPNPAWLWISLSALVVGQMRWSSWVWHSSALIRDEDRQLGDAVVLRETDDGRSALQGWFGRILQRSRWLYVALYALLTWLAWRADPNIPWILFILLPPALWVMPPLLTGIIFDFAGRVSRTFLHFVGIVTLVAIPLLVGVMMCHVAATRGFAVGTALGVLTLVCGMLTVQLIARSSLFMMAEMAVVAIRHRWATRLRSERGARLGT